MNMIKNLVIAGLVSSYAGLAQAENDWHLAIDWGVQSPDTSARLSKGSASTIDNSLYEGSPTFDYDDSSTVVGIAMGRAIKQNLRAELELRQRKSTATKRILNGSGVRATDTFQLDSSLKSTSLMLNGLVPISPAGNLTPYLKAGVGVTRHQTVAALTASINAFGIPAGAANPYPKKTENKFTWALGAGLAWTISPHTALELEYQYIDMGKASTAADSFSDTVEVDTQGHELTAGLSYRF